jgi:TonB family protein
MIFGGAFQKDQLMEKKNKFLKLPQLDGGNQKMKEFIGQNLQYPAQALENGIEGDVVVKFKVTGRGEIIDPQVVNGIGHGCDEEALRLVSLLSYQAVKNRGIRVMTNNKIKIPFRLPVNKPQGISVTYVESKKPQQDKPDSYSYTIKFNNPG